MSGKIHTIALCLIILFVTGCTALRPFPNAARSGDTVALAIGSPDNMTRANTTATFTSDVDSNVVDITPNIRSIFKIYADPASKVYESTSSTASLVTSAGHEPWLTVAVIDLPAGLTQGTGVIEFNTSAVYPDIGSHINQLQIPLEILPGTGAPHVFDYELGIGSQATGNLATLEPQPRAVFAPAYPSIACPCPTYGAIEIKATVPTSLGSLPSSLVRVLPEDLTVGSGSNHSVIHSIADSAQQLTVMYLSPDASLKYYEARFSVVLHSAIAFSGTPTIDSIRYFDIDGNEISGPVADYTAQLR